MRAISWLTLCVTVIVLLTVGCASIEGYEGDGQITTLTRFPRLAARIDFPEFSLDEPLSVTYSLEGLPELHYNYQLGLGITNLQESSGAWPPKALKNIDGQITFQLLQDQRRVVRELEGKIGKMYWLRHKGDVPFGFLYSDEDSEISVFHPSDLGAPQRFAYLTVRFNPGTRANGLRGRVRVVSDYVD